jgi:phage terminase large subunit
VKLSIPLTAKQSELHASLDKFDVTGYGGAKGGGKSHGLRSVILLRCLCRPGHTGALFRRTYPELEENHIGPLFRQFPSLREYYNSGRREIRIPELESEFKFRFCERQSDVDRYAGREYHTLGIEEAGDWPLDMAMRLMRNCNRSTEPRIKATAALTFNWGGIGHSGLKRIFVTRDLRDYEKKLAFNFILAKVEDNPAILENDPGYLDRLESEPNEALRRAYRHGDPDIIAGQFFELDRSVHLIKPFPIPKHWNWFGAYDYGFNHPAVWLFFAVDPDGKVYLVHEIVQAKLGIVEQAQKVHDTRKFLHWPPDMGFEAGHDCWAKRKGSDPSIAEDFLDENVVGKGCAIYLRRANIERVLGARKVREYLAHRINPPNFVMFENCMQTIECLTRMIHDPNKLEDVLKVDSSNGDPSTGDDPYDAVRYALMSRPSLNSPAPEAPKDKTPSWFRQEEDKMFEVEYQKLREEEGKEDDD